MGLQLMERAWKVQDIHSTEKYVLLTLAYYGDDTSGHSWISASEIAHLTGVSQRQIFRVLKALKARKYISNASGAFSKSLWSLDALIVADKEPEPA